MMNRMISEKDVRWKGREDERMRFGNDWERKRNEFENVAMILPKLRLMQMELET